MKYIFVVICIVVLFLLITSYVLLYYLPGNSAMINVFRDLGIGVDRENHSEVKIEPFQYTIPTRNLATHASSLSKCVVILRSSDGRLGNRLFMFASAYGLARTHACRLYIDAWILRELNSSFRIRTINTISKQEVENLKNIQVKYTVCRFLPELMLPYAVEYLELRGFWQTYGFFAKYVVDIKSIFTFHDSIAVSILKFIRAILVFSRCLHQHPIAKFSENSCLLKLNESVSTTESTTFAASDSTFLDIKSLLTMSYSTWIGVHVRRGDFWQNAMSSEKYVLDAIIYFKQKYSNAIFIIASDDKDYCIKHFGNISGVILTPKFFSSTQDLAVLASCQHSIVTAGSYGWWSALLAGGDVYHDINYLRDVCSNCSCSRESYYPPWFIFPEKVN